MKQVIIDYNELILSDDVAATHQAVLESLGIEVIIKDVPNNRIPIIHDLLPSLSFRSRSIIGQLTDHNWNMSIETFLHTYSICDFKSKYGVGEETLRDVNLALTKKGYCWCSYCKGCKLIDLLK